MTHHRTNPPTALVRLPFGQDGPRYRAGWWFAINEQVGLSRPEAWVMPASDDWIDIYPAPNWWQAMAKAIQLCAELPDCTFVGGPDASN